MESTDQASKKRRREDHKVRVSPHNVNKNIADRTCLKCDKKFKSMNVHNRVCVPCKIKKTSEALNYTSGHDCY